MAFKYDDIMRAQAQNIDNQQALAAADLEAARLTDDEAGVHGAAERILQLDLMRNALNVRAQQYLTAQAAQPQGNRWGLSSEEVEVAKASHGSGTPEQRIEEYARNKQRYQHMRATGQYRDDQGTVRR